MPRKPRYFLPGIPAHIVQRGHSKAPEFFDTADYRAYLNWFTEGTDRYDCEILAYVLMTNPIHLGINISVTGVTGQILNE